MTRHAGQLRVHDTLGTEYLIFNTRMAPFDDVRARRALNFAIDRRAIARALYGEGAAATPTCQALPPQMPGYRRYCPYTARPTPAGAWRAPDLARARRLVAASNTKGMAVVVLNPNTPKAGVDAARLLATTLRQIGYRARLKLVAPEDLDRLSSNHTRARFNIVPSGWFADYPAASTFIGLHLACSARLPRSDDSPNISGFCSPPARPSDAPRASPFRLTARPRQIASGRASTGR